MTKIRTEPARTEPASEPHTHIERYDPASIEPRWQARWAELGLHDTDLVDDTRPKYYMLTMYPYPSGAMSARGLFLSSQPSG